MAIHTNINRLPVGVGRAAGLKMEGEIAAPTAATPAAVQPASPAATPAQPTALATAVMLNPNLVANLGGLVTPRPPFPPVLLPPLALPKTTSQIAQGAINLLNGASQAVLQEAINTVKNRNIAADNLMNYLERKVIVGEVLNELARDWSDETKQDFAEAFRTTPDKVDVMDAIVSIAILNDPDLKDELIIENTPETTEGDLLENRRVVWQYPPPGTVLQPPYLILLAVEHRDTRRAEEVVQSILGALVDYQGYKVPKSAVQKLR